MAWDDNLIKKVQEQVDEEKDQDVAQRPNTSGRSPMSMIGDNVLLEVQKDNMTTGGIALPDIRKTEFKIGKVIARGPGMNMECGSRTPMQVKMGDMVKFITKKAFDIDIHGKSYMVTNESCIVGIL